MSQQMVQETSYENFKESEIYKSALPRPNSDQLRALIENILQYGQLDPIKVNKNMIILDGYTRYEILAERGRMIKFVIVEVEDELTYVVETNVMRRDLNIFQRVEAMYNLYKKIRLERRQKDMTIHYDVLRSLKQGLKTAKSISKATGYDRSLINKKLKELKEDYSVSVKKEFTKYADGNGGTTNNVYTIETRGEAILAKAQPRSIGGVNVLVGKTIGVNRNSITYVVGILEKGNEQIKQDCRDGRIALNNAYWEVMGSPHKGIAHVSGKTKLQCPHCDHIAPKKEFRKHV